MLSCFKLSVFVFIMGVNGENKAWRELSHAAIPHPGLDSIRLTDHVSWPHIFYMDQKPPWQNWMTQTGDVRL